MQTLTNPVSSRTLGSLLACMADPGWPTAFERLKHSQVKTRCYISAIS